MLQAGLRTVREEMTDENKEEAVQLIYAYTKRLQQSHITDKSDMKQFWEATIAVRKSAWRRSEALPKHGLRNIKPQREQPSCSYPRLTESRCCLPADTKSSC